MKKKRFEKLGIEPSLLGFGCMRFPLNEDGNIDENERHEYLEVINNDINNGEDSRKVIVDIRNRLAIGDTMEILVPYQLEPIEFKIEKLWDIDTDQEIDAVSPGVKDQKVKMTIPIKCEKDWILRRKK